MLLAEDIQATEWRAPPDLLLRAGRSHRDVQPERSEDRMDIPHLQDFGAEPKKLFMPIPIDVVRVGSGPDRDDPVTGVRLGPQPLEGIMQFVDRKSTRLNSSH